MIEFVSQPFGLKQAASASMLAISALLGPSTGSVLSFELLLPELSKHFSMLLLLSVLCFSMFSLFGELRFGLKAVPALCTEEADPGLLGLGLVELLGLGLLELFRFVVPFGVLFEGGLFGIFEAGAGAFLGAGEAVAFSVPLAFSA